jgi:hypothetical protein
MIRNHWLSITHHDSQPLAQNSTPWITTTGHNAELVVVNHGVLFWAGDCESFCVILSQWLWIMVCYSEPVVVNHGVHNLWHIIAIHDSQPLVHHSAPWIITTDPALHTMTHKGVLFWAGGCESCGVILSQWLWIMMSFAEPSGWESWFDMLNQWLWIMVCYNKPVVVNHGLLFWAKWLWIMVNHDEPVVVNQITCSVLHTMIHNHWFSIGHHES